MAAKKKIKSGLATPNAVPASVDKEEQEWKTRDDADRVKRYAELTRDKQRHSAAMDYIRKEQVSISDLIGDRNKDAGPVQPRGLARAGRKRSTRVARRGIRRK